jgi:hypothetical protein
VPVDDAAALEDMRKSGMPAYLIEALLPFAEVVRSGRGREGLRHRGGADGSTAAHLRRLGATEHRSVHGHVRSRTGARDEKEHDMKPSYFRRILVVLAAAVLTACAHFERIRASSPVPSTDLDHCRSAWTSVKPGRSSGWARTTTPRGTVRS